MPGRGKIFGKTEGYESKLYSFYLPFAFEKKAKIICLERRIDLSEFIRESINEHIKKYSNLIEKSKIEKPRKAN